MLCIKRVNSFEEGLAVINASRFGTARLSTLRAADTRWSLRIASERGWWASTSASRSRSVSSASPAEAVVLR